MPFWPASAASAALLAGLCIFLWLRRPPAPLWPIVFLCQLLALVWVAGDLWASHARGPVEKQIALTLLFSGSIPIGAAWWETVRRYVLSHGLGRPWMRSRWAQLPVGLAAASWLFAVTNPWHGAFLSPVVGGQNQYHAGFAAVTMTAYGVALATVALCAWAARAHPSPDVSRKMAILAVASFAPVVTNVLHLALGALTREDATSLGLGAASLAIVYGIYHKRLFNPLPIALAEVLRRDPAGVLVLDREGRLLLWNPAAEKLLAGVRLEPDASVLDELAPCLERSERDRRPRSARELLALLAGPQDGERSVYRFRGGTQERWLELSLVPVPSRRGKVAATCVRVEDVTALVLAEQERLALAEEVRQAERLKSLGLLAGGVAHDFNNLLTAIVGNARLAVRELPDADPMQARLTEILESTELAADLTQQLLAFAGRARIEMEAVDLRELTADMCRLLERSLAPDVGLSTNLDPALPLVQGDPTQLCQVVVNLVTNAVEALGDEPGFITIHATATDLGRADLAGEGLEGRIAPGRYVRLEVSDSGCGMDEATRGRAFDPFFSTKRAGRGLGLAAVFGIVRGHRGAIEVKSEEGLGTTFRVWLPVADEARSALPRRAKAPRSDAWRSGGTILVIDDDPRVRRLAQQVLGEAGFEVLAASGGEEGLRLARRNRGLVRLVLLDATMPGTDGAATLEGLAQLEPELPVLYTSGYEEEDALSRVPSTKLAGFLRKPWDPDALLAAVRRILERPPA